MKTRSQSESKFLKLPFGKAEIIGPHEHRLFVLPYRVEGALSGLVPVSQIPGVFYSVSLSPSGQVRLQCYNSRDEAIRFTPRTAIAALIVQADVTVEIEEEGEHLCANTSKEVIPGLPSLRRQYPDVFSRSSNTNQEKLSVLTVRAKEIHWKVPMEQIPRSNRGIEYSVGELSETRIQEHLDDLESRQIIRRVRLGEPIFYSPVLFLPKPRSKTKIRTVQDFRLLNSYMYPWRCIFPGTLATLRRIRPQWVVFSVLDLSDGFWNIPVDEELQQMFGMESLQHAYTWQRLPQGWSASPGLFQSRMMRLFEGFDNVIVYMDDLLLGSTSFSAHAALLHQVLSRMQEYGLAVNADKSQIGQKEVKFLGYNVEHASISLKTYLEEQCTNLPLARTKREVRRLVGIMNLCRSSCPRLDAILQPLTDLLKQATMPDLETVQSYTAAAWKSILTQTTKLHLLHPEEDLYLETDWSQTGCGFVLFSGAPELGRVVAVNSRTHDEKHLSSYLGELRTIQWALAQVKTISLGRKIYLYTDSNSSCLRLKGTPKAGDLLDIRVARSWSWILENYILPGRLEIAFLPGLTNEIADLLSRWSTEELVGSVEIRGEIQDLILSRHAAWGHFGVAETRRRLLSEGIRCSYKDVRMALLRCASCARFRRRRPPAPLSHLPDPSSAGELISVDVIGPLSGAPRGFRYIITLIDHLTRLGHAYPARSPTSRAMIRAIERWIEERGKPRRLLSDNASYLTSHLFKQWTQSQEIQHITIPLYSHASNGMIERYNETLIGRLRRRQQAEGGNWLKHLTQSVQDIASMQHSTTRSVPQEAWDDPAIWPLLRRRTAAMRDRVNQDRRRSVIPQPEFQVDDHVWYWDEARAERLDAKLSPFWRGPCVLKQQISQHVWEVSEVGSKRRWRAHSSFLAPYHSSSGV